MDNAVKFEEKDAIAVFIIQRWHELFDKFTPDSFQPKLLTIPCLVEEAVEIASFRAEATLWQKHLAVIQEEIRHRLEIGSEKELLSVKEVNLLKEISTTGNASDVYRLGRVMLLDGFASRFETSIREDLRRLASAKENNRKSEFDDLLSLVGSQAFRRGCNADDYADFETFVHKSPTEVVEWILNRIPAEQSCFDCIVAVDFQDKEEQSQIRSVLHRRGIRTASPKIPGLPTTSGVIFLMREITAYKDSQALHQLRIEVQDSLNLLGFYLQSRSPRVQETGWIYEGKGVREVNSLPRRYDNFHPRRNALDLAGKATKALSNSRGEAALMSSLDLHGQALRAEEDSLRLVNLWSATECLASLEDGKTIIGRVDTLISPIVTWRRLDKFIRYISISLHFWLKKNPQIDRTELPFPVGPNDRIDPERVLTVLAEPKDSKGIRSLLNISSGHPLLLYRISEGWKFVSDPKVMNRRQLRSRNALRWHLWRIYRARNLLVHRGIQSRFVPQLANHLQHYLSLTLSRIMHGLTFGEDWTCKDSITYWKNKAAHVDYSLQNEHEALVVGDIFPEEVIEPEYPVWKQNIKCELESGSEPDIPDGVS